MAGSGCTAKKAKDSALDPISLFGRNLLGQQETLERRLVRPSIGLAWGPTELTFGAEKLARVVWMARVVVVW